MGYRSDVRITTTTKGYEELKKYVDKYLTKHDLDETYNLLNHCDIFKQDTNGDNGQVYLGWNYIKWYDDFPDEYPDVAAIMDGLVFIEGLDCPYAYARIGENMEDIDEEWSNPSGEIMSPLIIRTFDDDIF